MAKLSESFIDNLLSRVDVVEIIGSRVPLKKQGKDYSARCPFHDERSPSFTVSPSKQFYYCFGCGAKGTAISFLMNYDRLTFMDAVEDLAKRAGIEIPKDAKQSHDVDGSKDMYAALEASSQFFQQQLAQSSKAKAYLSKRGVDEKSLAQFGIGWAPEGFNGLMDALGSDERRKGLLEKTGMLSKSDNGRMYDKFRGRVMFPIADRRGRIIAFGGRVLEKDDGPKYLNSPETPLFHKGRELYGLWQVKQAHNKIPRLIVVEGYMDVVSLFQHGIFEAVATLGTATTPDHAELLFRNSADVYFCFDGDKAGRAAAWKAVESIIPRMRDGRQAFFLFLPDGEDPDTIVKTESANGFEQRLKQAMTLSDYLFSELAKDVNLDTLEGKSRFVERVKPYIDKVPDGAFHDALQQRLNDTAVIKNIHAEANKFKSARFSQSTRAAIPDLNLVKTILRVILQNPKLGIGIPKPYSFEKLNQRGISVLIEILDIIHERSEISTSSILEYFEQHPSYKTIQEIALLQTPGEESDYPMIINNGMTQLNSLYKKQRIQELREMMSATGLSIEQTKELRELLSLRG